MTPNGIYLAQKTDDCVKAIHIDEDVLLFAKLNMLTSDRVTAAEKRIKAKKHNHHQKMKALHSTVKWSAAMFALAAGLLVSHFMGYIVPFIALPGTAVCLCIASSKIGLFVGSQKRKEKKYE